MAPLQTEGWKFESRPVRSEFIFFLSITIKFYYNFAFRSQFLDFNLLSASSSNINLCYDSSKTYIYLTPSDLSV